MDGDVWRGAQRAPSLQMPSESKLENQISKIENLKIEKNPPRKISESQSAKRIFQIRRLRSCRSRDSGSSFLQIVKGLCLKLQHVPTAMNRDSQDTPEVRV
jgi:hypothetical protein